MTLKTASVLAFEKNLDCSDGFFWQYDSAKPEQPAIPVRISEKSVRGTISNRLKNAIANDPLKLDAEIQKPNLQTIDNAALDEDKNTLLVKWSCKVLPFNGQPCACNNQDYQTALMTQVQSYIDEHGFSELAKRYAINIANARWLWRNRVGAERVEVRVRCGDQTLTFTDGKQYSIHHFDHSDAQLTTLTQWIADGLADKQFTILYIEAHANIGYGQQVFPSQELVLDTGNRKSKVLYQIDGKAGMHAQKIGNALRTIDTWYPDAEYPIAVEPYGAVTSMGQAFRQPKAKQDFYSLFDKWVTKGEKPDIEQQHYIIAVLIRGGVFGESGKE